MLSILGLVACGVLSPVAWIMGNTELKAIKEGRRDPSNQGMVAAGRVIGIIGTVLIGVGIVLFLVVALFVVVGTARA